MLWKKEKRRRVGGIVMLGRTVVLLRRDSSKDLKVLRKLAKYISRGREF